MEMKVIGMNVEKYIGQGCDGDFIYYPKEMERHIIYGISKYNVKYKITLWQEEGMCCSGYCSATWGYYNIEKVSDIGSYAYKPYDKDMTLEFWVNDWDNYRDTFLECNTNNEIFIVTEDDGDDYYPMGYYNVNMDLFEKTIRAKDKRQVYIFVGESGIGKSYLSHKLDGMTVYETDCNKELPQQIIEDVIVLGNKYDYTVPDIVSRIFGEFEPIIVYMHEYELELY